MTYPLTPAMSDPASINLIKRLAASLPIDHPLLGEAWYYLRQFPPCEECGAMTPQEAATRCHCSGDKDDCHGCDLWPDADAALAQPEPEGVTDEKLPPRVGHILRLAEIIREVDGAHDKGAAALAESILSHPGSRWRPAIEPVPVSERPWEREGWCDAEGKCWWGRPSEELCDSDWFLATRAEVEEFCDCYPPVVSLPHRALPVPQQEATDGP